MVLCLMPACSATLTNLIPISLFAGCDAGLRTATRATHKSDTITLAGDCRNHTINVCLHLLALLSSFALPSSFAFQTCIRRFEPLPSRDAQGMIWKWQYTSSASSLSATHRNEIL